MAEEQKPENQEKEAAKAPETETENQEKETKTAEDYDKEINEQKEKELQLIKQRNQVLEKELQGKSAYEPPENPDEKLQKECNKYLEGTGFKV